jgi:hypothetical protein
MHNTLLSLSYVIRIFLILTKQAETSSKGVKVREASSSAEAGYCYTLLHP